MKSALTVAVWLAVIFGALSAFVLLAAFASVVRDRARARRADVAGDAAVADLEQLRRTAEGRTVVPVRIELVPRVDGAYGWRVWDAAPLYPEQVEGVLVPYALGEVEPFAGDPKSVVPMFSAWNRARDAIAEDNRARLVETLIREERA